MKMQTVLGLLCSRDAFAPKGTPFEWLTDDFLKCSFSDCEAVAELRTPTTPPDPGCAHHRFPRQTKTVEHSEYQKGELTEVTRPKDPIEGIKAWVEDATAAGAPEPTAMCLATATLDASPSARYVLMRGIDECGLTFYTNFASRKGEELEENPRAAAAFWWPLLERQIRIEGHVERVSGEEADAYFEDRPIKSRFASAASPQSREVSDREALEAMMQAVQDEFPNGPPRPSGWGGFRIVPDRIEFWQGRRARLHDRFLYERTTDSWRIVRLAP